MQNFFDNKGHLTEAAFAALQKGSLSEEKRLEIAEHLAFCDECLLQYTLCLEERTSPGLAFRIGKSLRKQKRFSDLGRFVRVGAAACVTLALWLGGRAAPGVSLLAREQSIFLTLEEQLETMKGEFRNEEK